MKNIAIQCLLRPALTVVDRCLDYENHRAAIERIDRLLIDSEVEKAGRRDGLGGAPANESKGPAAAGQLCHQGDAFGNTALSAGRDFVSAFIEGFGR